MAERHLGRTARPTRQTALLRLTVARALAASTSTGAFEALEQAATDAAQCDTPDLEGLCFATLGTLREKAGRLDAALESMRRGVAAQRRDRARSERFRAALRELPLRSPGSVASSGSPGRPGAPVAPVPLARAQSDGVPDRPNEPHRLQAIGRPARGRPAAGRSMASPRTCRGWAEPWPPPLSCAVRRSTSERPRQARWSTTSAARRSCRPWTTRFRPIERRRAMHGFDPLFGPLDSLVESGVDDGPSGEETVDAGESPAGDCGGDAEAVALRP